MTNFQPIGHYFKKQCITMALNQPTKAKRKARVMVLYAAKIIDSAETLKLLQKSEELENA